MNYLHEEFYILLMFNAGGCLSAKNRHVLPYGLAGAILAELVQMEQVVTINDVQIQLKEGLPPTGSQVLESTLGILRQSPQEATLPQQVETLASQSRHLESSILKALLDRGVLLEQSGHSFSLSVGKRYCLTGQYTRSWIVMRLRNFVLSATPADSSTVILLDLLEALHRLPMIFDRYEMSLVKKWVSPLVHPGPIAQAVHLVYTRHQTDSLIPVP
jgi:hypothetical protein